MKSLSYSAANQLRINNLIRIGDLSYFEGPLLSLFENVRNNHLYIFDWVDRDEKSNRWLVYRVAPEALHDFIKGKISHLKLFDKRPDATIYYVDIENSNNFLYDSVLKELSEELLLEYHPNEENYFEKSDSVNFERMKALIQNALLKRKLENEYCPFYNNDFHKNRSVCVKLNRIVLKGNLENFSIIRKKNHETISNNFYGHKSYIKQNIYHPIVKQKRNTYHHDN